MSKIQANQIQHTQNGAAVFTLPTSDGSNGQFMKTDGSGALQFATVDTSIADGSITAAKLASGVGGKILQVKQTTKSNTFETNSGSYIDIPGLSVDITPASSSNKILFISSVNFGANSGGQHNFYQVVRDSTTISATAQSIRFGSDLNMIQSYSCIILDSPSSTSSLTYKIQVKPESTSSAVGVNRNIGNNLYGFSTILCMEVSA